MRRRGNNKTNNGVSPITPESRLPDELLTAVLCFTNDEEKKTTRLVSKRWQACTKAALDFDHNVMRREALAFFNVYLQTKELDLISAYDQDYALHCLTLLSHYLQHSLPEETHIKQQHLAAGLEMLMTVMDFLNTRCRYNFCLSRGSIQRPNTFNNDDAVSYSLHNMSYEVRTALAQSDILALKEKIANLDADNDFHPFKNLLTSMTTQLAASIEQARPSAIVATVSDTVSYVASNFSFYASPLTCTLWSPSTTEKKPAIKTNYCYDLLTKTVTTMHNKLEELNAAPELASFRP